MSKKAGIISSLIKLPISQSLPLGPILSEESRLGIFKINLHDDGITLLQNMQHFQIKLLISAKIILFGSSNPEFFETSCNSPTRHSFFLRFLQHNLLLSREPILTCMKAGIILSVKKRSREMKKNVHVILNPVAGGGKAGKLKGSLFPELKKRFGNEFVFRETTARGDAIRFAEEAVENMAKVIIAAGGDGTINEVINGMMTEKNKETDQNPELGILNCGSGGGLAQTLGLPGPVSDQLDLICGSPAKQMDAGFVIFPGCDNNCKERYFASEFQAGIGGSVVSGVGMRLKHFGGRIAFGSVALSRLIHFKASEIQLQLDTRPSGSKKMIGLVIGNGTFCAGGMKLTPDASIDDGWLDVLEIHEMDVLTRFANFGKIYSGKHVWSEYFSLTRAREIYVDSRPPVWIEADGELLGKTPCRIGIMPGAIKVRY